MATEPLNNAACEEWATVQAAAAGNRSAWDVLWEQHHRRLLKMVQLRIDPRLRGRVDAADILQEAWIEAQGRITDYAASGRPMPLRLWLRFLVGQRLLIVHRRHFTPGRDPRHEQPIERGGAPAASSEALAMALVDEGTRPSEAALNFAMHTGLFGLIRVGSSAAACWAWYLAFEAATWWVFLDRLFRGRRAEGTEQDLLVLWVGISLAGLTLFALYCPPMGSAGSVGLLEFYPPWAAVTGLGLFLAGRIHWGGLYLGGLGFFLLALLMPLAIEFAPLAYGGFLAIGLVWMGRVHSGPAGKVAPIPR